ncbi:MAG: SufE family protein [Planctomycetes bacterium]|nr:SufE family protein [Planctomycetota bacterium]
MANAALAYAHQNQQRFLSGLKDLLRIPSVSTLPEHKEDVHRAAQFVADDLQRIGLEQHLSPGRRTGLSEMIARVQHYAGQVAQKQ